MTGWSLGLRTVSDGSLQQLAQNGVLYSHSNSFVPRKGSKTSLSSYREKEKFLPSILRFLVRKQVGMLILAAFALLAFLTAFWMVNKEDASRSSELDFKEWFENSTYHLSALLPRKVMVCDEHNAQLPPPHALAMIQTKDSSAFPDPCRNFAFPPPPPGDRRRIGPRPCPVCYVPVEQAIARMPRVPSVSPGLQHLTYFHEQIPMKTEPHRGSAFGGYPSLVERNASFDIKESMTVHCGFVQGCRPGDRTGFDIDAADLKEMEQFHDVIVASAIFGNYDVIQQPKNWGKTTREKVPFYMFVDEETEASLKNSSLLDSRNRVGLWRIILVRNVPYSDARRNGKVCSSSFLLNPPISIKVSVKF
uniref:TOD1/MUCI70 glycosyltransferase-like domain-containing protein n=1 Tax=Solanum tuberosum TaxID=4113 RepID=M1AX81_SOLTU